MLFYPRRVRRCIFQWGEGAPSKKGKGNSYARISTMATFKRTLILLGWLCSPLTLADTWWQGELTSGGFIWVETPAGSGLTVDGEAFSTLPRCMAASAGSTKLPMRRTGESILLHLLARRYSHRCAALGAANG